MKIEIIIKIKINVFKKYDKIIKTNENTKKLILFDRYRRTVNDRAKKNAVTEYKLRACCDYY